MNADAAVSIRDVRLKLPDGADFQTAAAAMLQGMTAHYLTHSTFPLKEGDTCLIHAAAGGTGALVAQMAKMRGARVLGTVSTEEKARVAREVTLPEGVHLQWAGEYGELQAANRRLAVVVPFALILIAGVLYGATTSLIDTFIIMAQIPVACLGGILALYLTGTPFSVSAAVGFISIFGIAVMDGILLSFYIRQLWDEGHPFVESIVMGSDRRLRATMMTDLVDALGLLPAALSTRIGAQTQQPLAIVVIGGALAIMLLTRVLQPALIYLCHRDLRRADEASRTLATT